jgi:predicted transcriptional regulator
VAITLRLDAARVRQLQAIAEAENRTLTNFMETALIHDLARRDEAAQVITMHAAPGTSDHMAREDIERGKGEPDEAFARRRNLLTELWSIPDSA